MDALEVVIVVASVASLFAWIASLLTRDTSWVDRSWSILPVAYVGIFSAGARFTSARLDLMTILVLAWGVRLTYNFARRGGYRGVEDYRWAVLRNRMSQIQFQLFNFFFIVIYQNLLLVLITLGAEVAWRHRTPLKPLDVLLGVIFVVLLVGETLADQQQWNFQLAKHQRRASDGPSDGSDFVTTGLFRYSRHPNYFCEISMWWVIYFFGSLAEGSLWNIGLVGALLLSLLFVGSTRFTESISASKYPTYSTYQRSTPAIVPWRGARVNGPRDKPTDQATPPLNSTE